MAINRSLVTYTLLAAAFGLACWCWSLSVYVSKRVAIGAEWTHDLNCRIVNASLESSGYLSRVTLCVEPFDDMVACNVSFTEWSSATAVQEAVLATLRNTISISSPANASGTVSPTPSPEASLILVEHADTIYDPFPPTSGDDADADADTIYDPFPPISGDDADFLVDSDSDRVVCFYKTASPSETLTTDPGVARAMAVTSTRRELATMLLFLVSWLLPLAFLFAYFVNWYCCEQYGHVRRDDVYHRHGLSVPLV